MNHDDFEQRLQRQPLRQVPAQWREEILATAGRAPERPRRSSLVARLSTVLWPHPVAWAGLAAVWIFIFAVDFSARDNTPVVAETFSPPPAEVMVEVRQQQRLLVELIGPRDVHEVDRSRSFAPRPRSEFVGRLAA